MKLIALLNNKLYIFLPDRAKILCNIKILETMKKCIEDEIFYLHWIDGKSFDFEFKNLQDC